MDADRTGILPFIWEPGYGFARYTEYALDVPMYFRYEAGEYVDATAQRTTFRQFMEGQLPSAPGRAPAGTLHACAQGVAAPARSLRSLRACGSGQTPAAEACSEDTGRAGTDPAPGFPGAWSHPTP